MYTHCPHCHIVFRVHAEQLAQARGQVRCGVCDSCFNALETLAENLESLPAADAARNAVAEHAEHYAYAEEQAAVSSAAIEEHHVETAEAIGEVEASAEQDIVTESLAASFTVAAERMQGESPGAVNPDWKGSAVHAESLGGNADLILPLPERAVAMQALDTAEPLDKTAEEVFTPISAQSDNALPDLGVIAAEPRAIATAEGSGAWLKILLWSAANIVLILVLLGQYAYFNRHELAQYPELRPWVTQLCAVMACDMPLRRDVSRIALTNRLVESHPRVANALLIDATLVNDADFPQPFPLLEIRFSDLESHLVAGRRFRPSEYLADSTLIASGMPPHQTVHIVLEIRDPGKDAVSFQFEML